MQTKSWSQIFQLDSFSRIQWLACTLCLVVATTLPADLKPPELGHVDWLRSLQEATDVSRNSGKPILLLFQEIPGCQTCKNFGAGPLSHPLIVEAMEDLFVPLAIHNNRPGEDETVLKKFDEPAWNNPVIRYLSADHAELIPRKDRQWSVGETAAAMVTALEQAGAHVPMYLRLLKDETNGPTATATIAMHCYWEGEGRLGSLPGVEQTRAGWLQGKEVVELTYDPKKITYADLLRSAKTVKCASHVYAKDQDEVTTAQQKLKLDASIAPAGETVRAAKPSDQHYYLTKSPLRHLALTRLQATRVNAALRQQKDAHSFLSPRQRDDLEAIRQLSDNQSALLSDLTCPTDPQQLSDYSRQLRRTIHQAQ